MVTKNLINMLNFAKNYALYNFTTVKICPSNDMKHCSSNWSKGYIVFTDHKIIKRHKFEFKHSYLNLSPNFNSIAPANLNNFTLTLHSFGENQNIIKIEKDSSTFNNGHFYYNPIIFSNYNPHSTNGNNISNAKTYICWNKSLRIYVSNNGCIREDE